MRARSSRTASLLLAISLASGCYMAHGRGEGSDGGADRDAERPRDGGFLPDGAPWPDLDGGLDAGLDGGPDAGFDAGWDSGGVDGGPPPPPPPDPTSCRIVPEIHAFDDPVLETRWPSGPVVHSEAVHVCSTPLVIDLDGGDTVEPKVVFVSYADLRSPEPPGVLRIWDPRSGTTVSSPSRDGERGYLEASGNLAAGDVDGDGDVEILGLGVVDGTVAYEHDGSVKWTSPYPTASDRGLNWSRSIGGATALADLEGDGTIEVIAGRNVLDAATGAHRWTGAPGTGRGINTILGPISCAADLDADGVMEVISGFTAFRADGRIYWDNPTAQDGFCAVAELDASDPGVEVVLVSSGYVRVLDGQTGEVTWLRQLEGRLRASIGGAPTVADFDGDGVPEIGVAHGNAYGVYDLACEAPGRPAGCIDEGLLWQTRTSDASSSGTGSSVFDFNGDGRAEVVYNDEQFFSVYDGTTGRPLFQHRNSSRTRTENPTIADVDNDGDAEIVFSANAEATFLRPEFWTDPGVEIWGDRRGRWVGARRVWNQHAYHISNVDERGVIASPERDSWTVLNAYRQNLREGGDVLVVPDLWGGHGRFRCTGPDRAILEVDVQNWGLERVGPGVVVGFYRGHPGAGDRVAEAVTTRTLEPGGGSETVRVEVSLPDPVVDWYARLDDPASEEGDRVLECREGNNDVLIWRPWCP